MIRSCGWPRGALRPGGGAEQPHGVLSSAPEELRAPLLGLKTTTLVGACAALRPGPLTSTSAATKTTLRTLARRWQPHRRRSRPEPATPR